MNLSTFLVRRVKKVATLDRSTRNLLLRAWLLVTAMEPAIHLFKLKRVSKWLENQALKRDKSLSTLPPGKIGAIVEAASKNSPARPKCLAIAVTTQYFLQRYGITSSLKIGVSKETGIDFAAHAWVEVNGELIVGAHEKLESFRTIYSRNADK